MLTRDFDFSLPPELIAQRPLAQRSASRLLHLPEGGTRAVDRYMSELPGLLRPGDLLVFNNTRVFPARVFGRKASGGQVEILVERLLGGRNALAHVRASKSPKPGSVIHLDDGVHVTVGERRGELFTLSFACEAELLSYLEIAGRVPLPPYIERDAEMEDSERYQTVFAEKAGAVAAPTAGLHFDAPLFKALEAKGIDKTFITLHVGAGTFQPVRADHVADHVMHAEWVEVSESVCRQITDTRNQGGRVIAVGTTVVRSLEAAALSGELRPFSGETNIFITPGFEFRCVDAIITNFHLPRSSLLMLICGFGGHERIMRAYQHAVWQRYRFFSYGDAMLIERQDRDKNEE